VHDTDPSVFFRLAIFVIIVDREREISGLRLVEMPMRALLCEPPGMAHCPVAKGLLRPA
jgi:hypothetical protein